MYLTLYITIFYLGYIVHCIRANFRLAAIPLQREAKGRKGSLPTGAFFLSLEVAQLCFGMVAEELAKGFRGFAQQLLDGPVKIYK